MTQRRRRLLLTLMVAVTAIAMAPGLYLQYLVHYHRHRLRLAREHKLIDAPSLDKLPIVGQFLPSPIPPNQSESYWEFEQADKHRDALVELGELEKERFVLKHLKHATPEGRHFSAFLVKMGHGRLVDGVGNHSWESIPIEWTLWTECGEMDVWRQFFTKYDVPNYWEIRDQSIVLPEPETEEN